VSMGQFSFAQSAQTTIRQPKQGGACDAERRTFLRSALAASPPWLWWISCC